MFQFVNGNASVLVDSCIDRYLTLLQRWWHRSKVSRETKLVQLIPRRKYKWAVKPLCKQKIEIGHTSFACRLTVQTDIFFNLLDIAITCASTIYELLMYGDESLLFLCDFLELISLFRRLRNICNAGKWQGTLLHSGLSPIQLAMATTGQVCWTSELMAKPAHLHLSNQEFVSWICHAETISDQLMPFA